VDTDLERPRWRLTATYRIHRNAQVGFEYNPVVAEVGPLASLFLLTETDALPALFAGTSSDRIGSPEGTQAYYLTASKLLPGPAVSAYASLNYSEWDEGLNAPFGAEWFVWRGLSARYMYDGERSHVLASAFADRIGVSRDGDVVRRWTGTIDMADVRRCIDALLEEGTTGETGRE